MDESLLGPVAALAVAEAIPQEVMPVPAGTEGWTPDLARRFVEHHRERLAGWDGPNGERCSVVMETGQPVGVARLAVHDANTLEAGLWLARSARSRGVGTAVFSALRAEAARSGATLRCGTTADNRGAVTLLRRAGARLTWHPDGTVSARSLP
jgi:RimJ/RimL family protein N-acetyltransferase